MEFDSTTWGSQLTRKLKAMRKDDRIPSALLDLIANVAELQLEAEADARVEPPAEDKLASPERNVQGAPILPRGEFPFDRAQAGALFDKLLKIAEEAGEPMRGGVGRLREALGDGRLDLDAAFAAHVSADETLFTEFSKLTPESPRLLPFLIQAALAPSLRVAGRMLAERCPKNRAWTHGHCPACGSLPVMATLREKEGHRHLSCSFCNLEYRAQRMMCPFCGEEDHDKLAYFTASGEPGFQVNACASCGSYIKTADFRGFDRLSVPILDDVESMALDLVAARQGLRRPTTSAWGF